MRVEGLEHIPRTGPVIVAPNHLSHLDPPIVACSVPRKVAFMAKEELFRNPLFGRLISSLNAFPVRRGEGDTEAIRKTLERLEAGELVLVFPEGTRGDGRTLGPFNRGVGMLAKRSGAVVVPAGIAGTERKLPRGGGRPRFARTTIVFGPPLEYRTFEEADRKRARDLFADALRASVEAAARRAGLALTSDPTGTHPATSSEATSPNEPPDSAPA
ncbi:MAG: 1-acyl-sn-glycerol-3-phosphate acyltransferase [Chthonomonadaceae bacterium]|nr:1-acyl-sn-glycerol-3-phosphate acyltransferase [Chthonomonadaceae bacterium]